MVDAAVKLQMKLSESAFPFSKRMWNFFEWVELYTVGDLADIPLEKFTCFRGFATQCRKELIAFIEFEEIESLFEGFESWKSQPYRKDR